VAAPFTWLRSPLTLAHETGVLRPPGWTVPVKLTPSWPACAVTNYPEACPAQPLGQWWPIMRLLILIIYQFQVTRGEAGAGDH
jgi:hypothetical protein